MDRSPSTRAPARPHHAHDAVFSLFDEPGPCDASDPAADELATALTTDDVAGAWAATRGPLAVRVHIPACDSPRCRGGCHGPHPLEGCGDDRYRDALGEEIAIAGRHLHPGRSVARVAFGVGASTCFTDAALATIVSRLREHFAFARDAALAIDADARTVTSARLAALRSSGFERIGLAVHDLDPTVQLAIRRVQAPDSVRALIHAARLQGFRTIDVDLVYGLPKQTPTSFARTVAMTIAMRPDRIALLPAASLERVARHDVADDDRPHRIDRLAMLEAAVEALVDAGYRRDGTDRFALPSDDATAARVPGDPPRVPEDDGAASDGDLLGLGLCTSGRVGDVRYRNACDVEAYCRAVADGRLPVERATTLSRDDALRGAAIGALMSDGRLDFATFASRHRVDARSYFGRELDALRSLAADGLVRVDRAGVTVTRAGWLVARAVAATFDRGLRGTVRRPPACASQHSPFTDRSRNDTV